MKPPENIDVFCTCGAIIKIGKGVKRSDGFTCVICGAPIEDPTNVPPNKI